VNIIFGRENDFRPKHRPQLSVVFRFSEVDSAANIMFEEREKSSGVPLIKVRLVWRCLQEPIRAFIQNIRT
jgi:hypothetical protein